MARVLRSCPHCRQTLPRLEGGVPPNFCPHCQFPMKPVGDVYALEARLGAGAFGTVYRARHLHRQTRHAIKVMRWDVVEDMAPDDWGQTQKQRKQSEFEQRFQREVRLTTALAEESWHIVRIEDAGSDPVHGLFYVMELLEGAPLSQFLERWPTMARRLAFPVMEQICRGVEVAHQQGVIHRDLKPENIILLQHEDEGRFVKVLDFGIAKALDDRELKLTSRPVGTPLYMAPEQCANRSVDQRADIYALGCLFYHLLTGAPPFDGDLDIPQLMLHHVQSTPPSLLERCPGLGIPPGFNDAVMRALVKRPEGRYPTVRAFWNAIRSHQSWLMERSVSPATTLAMSRALASPSSESASFASASFALASEMSASPPGVAQSHKDTTQHQIRLHEPAAEGEGLEWELDPVEPWDGKTTHELWREVEPRGSRWLQGAALLSVLALLVLGGWAIQGPVSAPSNPASSSPPMARSQAPSAGKTVPTPMVVPTPAGKLPAGGRPAPRSTPGRLGRLTPAAHGTASKTPPAARLSRLQRFLRRTVSQKKQAKPNTRRSRQKARRKSRRVARVAPSRRRTSSRRKGRRFRRQWIPGRTGSARVAAISLPRGEDWPGGQQVRIPAGRVIAPPRVDATVTLGAPQSATRMLSFSRSFWLWRTEVTQGQFQAVMGYNPAHFRSCGARCPVENVSWHEAAAFCNEMSRRQKRPVCFSCTGKGKNVWCMVKRKYWGKQYTRCKGWRLPTEAEWEYAYRAGSPAPYYSGRCLSARQANFNGAQVGGDCPRGPARKRTLAVGSFSPNNWRLYDMAGNVWEWVYDSHKASLPSGHNPVRIGNSHRVVRGGGWYSSAKECRAVARESYFGSKRGIILGFRPARTR